MESIETSWKYWKTPGTEATMAKKANVTFFFFFFFYLRQMYTCRFAAGKKGGKILQDITTEFWQLLNLGYMYDWL